MSEQMSRSARQIRRARARRLAVRFGAWVVVPTLLASIYYGCIATPQYESVAVVTVQSSDGPTGLDTLAAILPSASASGKDTLVVREYIRSRGMLDELDEQHGVVEHYQTPDADWWSRLDEGASRQDAYKYYLDKVDVEHDSTSHTLTLRVRAYDPKSAQAFARTILADAEEMVNQMNARSQNDRIALTQREVAKAEARLSKARADLLALQAEGGELDPTKTAAAIYEIKSHLETELAKVQAELDAARALKNGNSPEVIQLRQRVSSLQRQIGKQNERLAGSENGDLTESIAKFEPALVEKEFAQRAYETALKSLEVARLEASRQHRYLVTIAEPSLPDTATHPKRLWGVLRVFFVMLALMGVISLLFASVREHAKF